MIYSHKHHNLTPKKPNEIFAYICHFIFAIVIATSYDTATQIFINPEIPFLSNLDSVISSFEICLAYVAIISGWVGYSRSMIKWPHKNTKIGALRFSLDIAILFCYFGLITSAQPQNEFQNYFLSWISGLFVLFVLWDVLKIKEHYEKHETKRNGELIRSCLKTVVFLIVFFALPLIFTLLSEIEMGVIDDNIIYMGVMGLTMFLLILYRYTKWSINRSRKSGRGKNNKFSNTES